MKYIDIIEKLKTLFDIEDFAFECQQYDFENYPEALEAQKVRQNFIKLHRSGNDNWDSIENMEIYKKLPDEYKIINKLYRQSLGFFWEEIESNNLLTYREQWYSVKYFPDYNVYIKVVGRYCPHNEEVFFDEQWDCCKEVKPIEKTIITYE